MHILKTAAMAFLLAALLACGTKTTPAATYRGTETIPAPTEGRMEMPPATTKRQMEITPVATGSGKELTLVPAESEKKSASRSFTMDEIVTKYPPDYLEEATDRGIAVQRNLIPNF